MAEGKAQTSVCTLSDVHDLLLAVGDFIPLRAAIVSYFYHAW